MKQTIDEKIRNILIENDINLPDECRKRMSDTINGLSDKGIHKWHLQFRSAAAVIVVCILMTSITVYAAVDYVKQRMENLSKEEKNDYYEGLQTSTAGADSYSRELTEFENDKMEDLKVKYKNGQFPEKALTIVKTQAAADGSAELYFVEDTSLFVIPSRELTEEEMLEIIDFYYCRDYSLMEKVNQENKTADNTNKVEEKIGVDEDKAVELAKTVVKDIYGMDCTGFDITVEYDDSKGDIYIVTMKDSDTKSEYRVNVDAAQESIAEVSFIQQEDYSVTGITVDREKFITKYEDALDILTLKMKIDKPIIQSTCEYNFYADGSLERGVVSYLFEMEDGTGYVVKYSCVYDVFFDIFETDYNKYRQTMDQNESNRKKRGLEREIIQME